MMNRMDEYAALLQELEQTPAALEMTVDRAVERQKNMRKKRRILGIPAGSLAACFVAFMLLVNFFPTFAYACGQVPLLKELARAVAWSPSLSAAVENEYVQPVEQSQTKAGITATVHYVIVDQKQINIFYSLDYPKASMEGLQVDYSFGKLEGWAGSVGTGSLEPGTLQRINLSFMEDDVPGAIDLTITVNQMVKSDKLSSMTDSMFEECDAPFGEYLAEFTFHLKFDPYFTAQGEVIPVNQTFALDGQTLTLTEVELYPTHLRINLEDAKENISWLEGLDLYVENERGEQFCKSVNGITATRNADGEGLAIFWLDSPFFQNSEHLTLYIERVKWKEKNLKKIRVDLKNNTCSELPLNTQFGGAEKHRNGWILNFIHPYEGENTMYNTFSHTFWDEEGNAYDILSNSSTFGYVDAETGERLEEDTCFTESFPLVGYHGDIVYLETMYNQITEFSQPVTIAIK